jgi:phospholipid/cholesterol/gamma-HCH transport system substrate-binding protein
MNQTRYAARVGLFIFIGLLLTVSLLLAFSKGLTFFKPTYEIRMKARNVAGLQEGANVLLSGVAVGSVAGAEVAPDGRGVLIRLKIDAKHRVHRDARFVIEQVGFLGDQYVAIYPTENKAPLVEPGEAVDIEVPVSIQEVARSASDLLAQASQSLKVLNNAVSRVDRTVLGEEALTNITAAIGNFRLASTKAVSVMDGLNNLVATNTVPISISVSNLARFSEDMDRLALEMHATVATNRGEFTKAVQNLEKTTAVLERLALSVEQGRGLAGSLLAEGPLKDKVASVVSNMVVLSSNLNRYGILYKPRGARAIASTNRIYPGRTPFD